MDAPLGVRQHITLNDYAFHYLIRVLRCRDGEVLCAFNGDGLDYRATLQINGKKSASLLIDNVTNNDNESTIQTTLIQGLAKGERMDIVMQKAVELGVNTIIPVRTAFCSVKMDDKRLAKKHLHWQAIITSACEQCERAVVPTLQPLQMLDDALQQVQADCRWVLHPYPAVTPYHDNAVNDTVDIPKSVAVLVGPEGGFAEEEMTMITTMHQYMPKKLGKRILRTETAAIAALALIQQQWGDWYV